MTFKILTGTPTIKTLLGRSTHRWEDNIRMNLKEIGQYEELVDSAQDMVYWSGFVNAALNFDFDIHCIIN